eukprot:gene4827-8674_t
MAKSKITASTQAAHAIISSSLVLQPQSPLSVSPSKVLLADVQNMSFSVTIQGGTGIFMAKNTTRTFSTEVHERIVNLASKSRGTGRLIVEDQCLLPRIATIIIPVEVLPVKKLTAAVQDKLQIGSSMT